MRTAAPARLRFQVSRESLKQGCRYLTRLWRAGLARLWCVPGTFSRYIPGCPRGPWPGSRGGGVGRGRRGDGGSMWSAAAPRLAGVDWRAVPLRTSTWLAGLWPLRCHAMCVKCSGVELCLRDGSGGSYSPGLDWLVQLRALSARGMHSPVQFSLRNRNRGDQHAPLSYILGGNCPCLRYGARGGYHPRLTPFLRGSAR